MAAIYRPLHAASSVNRSRDRQEFIPVLTRPLSPITIRPIVDSIIDTRWYDAVVR